MKKIYFQAFFAIFVLVFGTSWATASVEIAHGSIWAGQQYEVAWWTIHAETDGLTVRIFHHFDDWDIVLSHVGVVESPCDFPQTKKDPCDGGAWIPGVTILGNPKIGHFGFGQMTPACEQVPHEIFIPYTAVIDGAITPGGSYSLYVAIHVEVILCDGGMPVEGIDETGWGGPCGDYGWIPGDPFLSGFYNFGDKQWNGYFVELNFTIPTT